MKQKMPKKAGTIKPNQDDEKSSPTKSSEGQSDNGDQKSKIYTLFYRPCYRKSLSEPADCDHLLDRLQITSLQTDTDRCHLKQWGSVADLLFWNEYKKGALRRSNSKQNFNIGTAFTFILTIIEKGKNSSRMLIKKVPILQFTCNFRQVYL